MIEIKQDVFDIALRLREIDPNYKLFFNSAKARFEVHSRTGLEVVCPFSCLDIRLVSHVKKTRIENRHQLIEEIDKINARVEKVQRQKIIEKALVVFEEQICK